MHLSLRSRAWHDGLAEAVNAEVASRRLLTIIIAIMEM
jgi:hypothetical protein